MTIRELFDGYRIENENPTAKRRDTHLDYVLCHRGHIGVWGKDRLYASLDNSPHLRSKLAALGTVVQDGDDGLTITFPLSALPAVRKVMEPRRQYRKAG